MGCTLCPQCPKEKDLVVKVSEEDEIRKEDEEQGIYDPFQGVNRKIFAFNQFLDGFFWKPIIAGYTFVCPSLVRRGVSNLLNHLDGITSLANAIFQWDGHKTLRHLSRFLVNTVFGLGGLVDVAGMMGVPHVSEDFGKTLQSLGVGPGYYMVIPFFGPTTTRDSFGLLMDTATKWPIPYGAISSVPQFTLDYMEFRDRHGKIIDKMSNEFKDFYRATRNFYYEIRKDLKNAEITLEDADETQEKASGGAHASGKTSLWKDVEDWDDEKETPFGKTPVTPPENPSSPSSMETLKHRGKEALAPSPSSAAQKTSQSSQRADPSQGPLDAGGKPSGLASSKGSTNSKDFKDPKDSKDSKGSSKDSPSASKASDDDLFPSIGDEF